MMEKSCGCPYGDCLCYIKKPEWLFYNVKTDKIFNLYSLEGARTSSHISWNGRITEEKYIISLGYL